MTTGELIETGNRTENHHRKGAAGRSVTSVLHGDRLELAPPRITVAVEELQG